MQHGDWSKMVVRRPRGCSMWEGILAGWKRFHNFILIRVEMAIVKCFGMIYDVKINLCRSYFQTNTPLQGSLVRSWRTPNSIFPLERCLGWGSMVTHKVSFFVLTNLNCILTIDNFVEWKLLVVKWLSTCCCIALLLGRQWCCGKQQSIALCEPYGGIRTIENKEQSICKILNTLLQILF